ncbi:MAG TPA: phosphoribosylformylglycinamidine synthase subunit PurQ [Ignavibacteriaceae bacterium]|nr:phosphoribosylformylglycinamidine synthase subunit PurQ [Ignavibacteriaceae bacterium]
MNPKFGVVVFPGSNCDHDAYYSLKKVLDTDVRFLWHKDKEFDKCDVIVLPGGFSYGDYIRAGAVAKLSPIMNSVSEFAEKGGIVIGICNGFQILVESGLLPGVLLKNSSLKFVCKDVYITPVNRETIFTSSINGKKALKVPIAHGEGNYFADEKTMKSLVENNRIVFKYSTPEGEVNDEANPNGSLMNIAGIINEKGNVLGMMPHPERSTDPVLNKTDGALIFKSIIDNLTK